MKGYLIDVAAREVREVEYDEKVHTLQSHVGGYIEVAASWPAGDVCFVDEEGLFKPQTNFFRLANRNDQPLAGNGIVVGREVYDREGNYLRTEPPAMTLDELRACITWLSRAQADSWAKGNASEPATTISSIVDGKVQEGEVIQRFGSLFAGMPRPQETPEDE